MPSNPPRETPRRAALTRRELCAGAGACLLLAGIPACTVERARLGEGGLTNGDGVSGASGSDGAADARDLATTTPPPPNADLAGPRSGDLASPPATCTAGSVAAGSASSYAVGATPRYFSSGNLFVLRDAGGLFAVSAICTHQGATVEVQGSVYYCPRHSATFAFDGSQPTGVAKTPLPHLAVCVDGGGNVTVDPGTVVPAGTRS